MAITSLTRLARPARSSIELLTRPVPEPDTGRKKKKRNARERLRGHWQGIIILPTVLAIVFWVHWRGLGGWPGDINYDEGTYTLQAYAVDVLHRLTPGPYTYDHPPAGWILMAGFFWVTGALHRAATSIIAGREFMLLVHMWASTFLYLLARRLGMRPLFAGAAVLLFSLSPLGLEYQRFVFLDNIAVLWCIIALWALASPHRGRRSVVVGGIAFGLAVLSKETILVLVFGVMLAFYDYRDDRNQRMLGVFWRRTCEVVVALYAMLAITKNELLPGLGHVSLVGTAEYQLVSRAGSGSLLDPGSGTYHAAMIWLHSDPFLLGGGLVAAVIVLFVKRYRAVSVCLLIQVLAMCRNGYLPFAYATALFPFAALCIAGVGDLLWSGWRKRAGVTEGNWRKWLRRATTLIARLVLVAAVVVTAVGLWQSWGPQLRQAMDAPANTASAQAATYIMADVPESAYLVTEDDSWTDLTLRGRPVATTLLLFKVDLDPAIQAELTHNGRPAWQSIKYLLLEPADSVAALNALGLRTVAEAEGYGHAVVVRTFGNTPGSTFILYKVTPPKK